MQKQESRNQPGQLLLDCERNLYQRYLLILPTRNHWRVLSREMSVPDLHFSKITLAVVDGWTGGYPSFDSEG